MKLIGIFTGAMMAIGVLAGYGRSDFAKVQSDVPVANSGGEQAAVSSSNIKPQEHEVRTINEIEELLSKYKTYNWDGIIYNKKLQPTFIDSMGRSIYCDVVGYDIEYHSPTDSDHIYMDHKLTILELHPGILADLITYIDSAHICYFRDERISMPFDVEVFSANGWSHSDIAYRVLGWEEYCFEEEWDEILAWAAGSSTSYCLKIELYPVFLDKDYVTYHIINECCTGGAHGRSEYGFRTYNRKTGARVELDDIIKPSMMEQFRRLVLSRLIRCFPPRKSETTLDNCIANILYSDKDNFPIGSPAIHDFGITLSYEYGRVSNVGFPLVFTEDEIKDYLQ